jgi:hypothetical protein
VISDLLSTYHHISARREVRETINWYHQNLPRPKTS